MVADFHHPQDKVVCIIWNERLSAWSDLMFFNLVLETPVAGASGFRKTVLSVARCVAKAVRNKVLSIPRSALFTRNMQLLPETPPGNN